VTSATIVASERIVASTTTPRPIKIKIAVSIAESVSRATIAIAETTIRTSNKLLFFF
jgi:hypothetical protein